ncbi:hypothetical protein WJX82_000465 [Trebouxia sp. C0006]
MKRHFLGRALTGGKRHTDDRVSDRAAEGFLQTALYTGVAFWQHLPFRTQRYGMAYVLHRLPAVADIILTPEYEHFAEAVMTSHSKADQISQ